MPFAEILFVDKPLLRITNHMNKPSDLEMKANYHLFKKGIKPMWEDPGNVKVDEYLLILILALSFFRVGNGHWRFRMTLNC